MLTQNSSTLRYFLWNLFLAASLKYMRQLIVLLVLSFAVVGYAQTPRLYITGVVRAAEDSLPLEGVVISTTNPNASGVSTKTGRYAIAVDRTPGRVITYRAFPRKTFTLTLTNEFLAQWPGDTCRFDVLMKQDSLTLREFVVRPGPDTVIGNWHFFIEDFAFAPNGNYVLLTYESSPKKAKVMLANEEQKILSSAPIPVEVKELFVDYEGNINVMCVDSAFRVRLNGEQISIVAMPYKDFCARMLPCSDTIGRRILFSNYHPAYPAFSYFTYDPKDSTVSHLKYIVDGPLLKMYNWEYDFLKPKDRLYARKMAAYTGIDVRIIAATMTGFPNSIYYTPLYAPLYVKNDTICVFDHYTDSLYLYDSTLQLIARNKIDYHHPKNWKEWDRRVYQDEVTGEFYARHERAGFIYLKKIDIKTGKVSGTYKIEQPWPKHLRIRNGAVYYIYRPKESIQKKYLYRELIVLR